MSVPTHLILRAAACLSVASALAGCSSADSRAQRALDAYQTAAAADDLAGARRALLQLVRAKDDEPDYWAELGKLQASTGSYGDAYYAFTRAYELDRRNPSLIRAVTELALRAGDIGTAESHARELEVIAPDDPWVKLADGWAAYSQSRYADAIKQADGILAASPNDPSGTVLKARAMFGLHQDDAAEEMLQKQVQMQPGDAGSLGLLAKLYERRGDWKKVQQTAEALTAASPRNPDNLLLLASASFRAGDASAGRDASLKLLKREIAPEQAAAVLDMWADNWPSQQRVQDAVALAEKAPTERRLLYAAFLNRIGASTEALRLVQGIASLPIKADNAEANAVLATALSQSGNVGAAKARFDAVLAFDPGNATALRGRASLALRTGDAAAAVVDAQKLVTVLPDSARDRLLLAKAYDGAGNDRWEDRTLWTAFQDIPADPRIYAALAARAKGNADASRDLQEEFERQLDAKLNRGLL